MLKTKLFVFLALFVGLLTNATSANYVKSHEDFVHLSDYEKNKIIIQTMELVVELESKYQYEVKKFGYSRDRFQKFQEAVSKISSIFFISSAFAEAPRPRATPGKPTRFVGPSTRPVVSYSTAKTPMNNWKDFGNTFAILMAKPGENCIFAGWPSKPYVDPRDNKTYCAHPDFIQGTEANRHSIREMSLWTKGYPNPKPGSGCGVDDRTKIQCNPTLFGYKKVNSANMANSTLFCVEAGNGAHNSAYQCMKEALKTTSNDTTDSANKRLSFLREQLSNSPASLKALQEFVYKTCVCDQTPANFSQKYKEYIRPHRTCYGMMEMMSKVVCGVPTPLNIDTGVFESLQNYTKDKIYYNTENKDTSLAAIDSHYTEFISHLKKNEAVEYNVLCKGAKRPDKQYDCSASCKTIAPATAGAAVTYDCSYVVKEKPNGTEVAITKPDLQPVEGKNLEFTTTIANKPVPLSCPVSITPLEVEAAKYTCSKAECKTTAGEAGAAATVSCAFTIASSIANAPPVEFKVDPSKMPAVGAQAGNFEFSGKISDKEEKLTCAMTLAPLEIVETKLTCSKADCKTTAGVDGAPATVSCAFTIASSIANAPPVEFKVDPSKMPAVGAQAGNFEFSGKISDKEEKLTCPMTLAPLEVITKPDDVVTTKTYECVKAECSAETPVASTAPTAGIAGLEKPATTNAASFTCSVEAKVKDSAEAVLKLSGSSSGTPEDGKESTINVTIDDKQEALKCKVTMKKAVVPPKIEPKPTPPTRSAGGPAPQNPGPPRTPIRGSSDTSAVGIK